MKGMGRATVIVQNAVTVNAIFLWRVRERLRNCLIHIQRAADLNRILPLEKTWGFYVRYGWTVSSNDSMLKNKKLEKVKCTKCGGQGKCLECNGRGKNKYGISNEIELICFDCRGSGSCVFCKGEGYIFL